MSRFRPTNHDLPAGPPPEVLQQIDVAWERARELFASDLELHFEVDADIGRVWAELRGADGALLAVAPPGEAASRRRPSTEAPQKERLAA